MRKIAEPQAAEILARALALHQQGNVVQAQELYRQVLARSPDHPDALHLLGVAEHQLGRHGEALALIGRAIDAAPDRWAFHSNLACARQAAGDLSGAIASYQQAIALGGESAPLLSNLGTVYQDAGQSTEAERCYRQALQLDPKHAESHYNLGNLLRETDRAELAIESFDAALRVRPTYVEALVNLANLLLDQGRAGEAVRRYRRALELNPHNPETHYNLARALKNQRDYAAALSHYDRAISLKPDHAAAHMLRGLILLYQGDFARGWPEYEWRWKKPDEQPLPALPQPLWRGENLDGKTILVYGEQGIGDEIMFANCLGDVIERADHCVIECDPRLVPLYRRSFPRSTVRPRHGWDDHAWLSQVRPLDYQVPVGNLPQWFRTSESEFPRRSHYLTIDADLVQKWRSRFETLGPGLKVGIAWRGSSNQEHKSQRSIPLATWEPLLRMKDVHFVNLQYGNVAGEIDEVERVWGVEIHDWEDADPDRDLDNLAAQMGALDLVLTIGNTNAHLAGALGLRVWTLLPSEPSWRWMEHGNTSPWYPSMRLFRQPVGADWQVVMHDVCQAIVKANSSTLLPSHVDTPQLPSMPAVAVLKKRRATITDARWGLHDATIHEAYRRAVRYHKEEEWNYAEGIYREILAHAPGHVDTLHHLGCLLRRTERRDEAVQYLHKAAEIGVARPQVQFDLGIALTELHRYEEAERALRRVIELDPRQGAAYVNLGVVCEKLGKLDDALAICQRGVQLLPDSAQAHYNLANVLLHQGRVPEALAHYERLLEIDPEFHRGRWNQGLTYLLDGQFERGWQGYRYRERAEQVQLDKFPLPEWDGSSLAGKTLLVHAEQGVGDEIMFNTCLPDVVAQAKKVHLTCDPRLEKLFARSFPQIDVHAVVRGVGFQWKPPGEVDCYTHAGTLPAFLRRDWASFPRTEKILSPDPNLLQLWRERFAALGPGIKVGISWRAGGHSSEQRRRTSLLDHWQPLFQVPGVHFVNLQYGDWQHDCEAAKARWGATIHDWEDADPLTDLDNFAAQVAALDAVVSVGNTTVHMAGALGVPTWAVLPRVPGWRYLLNGDWMPWYRSVRLRRQANSGDWDEVYGRVARELHAFASEITPAATMVEVTRTSAAARPPSTASETFTGGTLPREKIGEAFVGALKKHRAGRLTEAEIVYEQILELDPHHADSLHLSGVLFRQTGRLERALQRLGQAVSLAPANSIYAYNYASALRDGGRIEEAIRQLRRAVELNPHLAEAYLNLGTLLHGQGQLPEAITAYERALQVRPDYAEAHHNIGSALRDQGRLDQAAECYRRAIAIRPTYSEAFVNLSGTLRELGRTAEALEQLDRAVDLEPQNAEFHVQRAMLRLQQGQLDDGWAEWEWRWRVPSGPQPRPFKQPMWDGSSLRDKILLVHMEQGIGDEVMFASCLREVALEARRVIVECEPRLLPLFRRSFPDITWQARESWTQASWLAQTGTIDYQIPAGSLPRWLRRKISDFPRERAYLQADPARVEHWRRELRQLGAGLKIGVSWRGGLNNLEGLKRSIPLDRWKPLAKVAGAHFICLQHGECAQEIDATRSWHCPIHTLRGIDLYRDLDEVAALTRALDLVVSVSNATVHLAGALGTPTWVLLRRAPSWRWLNDRDDAVWYPSVQLIRQTMAGSWEAVLSEVASRLNAMLASGGKVPSPHAPLWPSSHPRPENFQLG
jgi:tetratricopeptide (TPR) repeat protein/ADP-heptose:LPS heptosyltransferase